MKLAKQCADSMEFLSSQKFLHGDLSARNVLLDSYFNAKICDFGLSKDVKKYDNNEYRRKSEKMKKMKPLRWMAPEAELFNIFSSCSDVWSYGE